MIILNSLIKVRAKMDTVNIVNGIKGLNSFGTSTNC
jgi:hypothetical protein